MTTQSADPTIDQPQSADEIRQSLEIKQKCTETLDTHSSPVIKSNTDRPTRMSARTEAPAPPRSVSQLWDTITGEQKLHTEITVCLHQINNGTKRAGRFLRTVFKRLTHNDQEFVPVLLNHVFGLRQVQGKLAMEPNNPGFEYCNGVRRISRNQLFRLMQKKYRGNCLSKKQVRRVFEAFQRAGLVSVSEVKSCDPETGLWTTPEVYYKFELKRWQELWAITIKTPKVKRGKPAIFSGTTKSATDTFVQPYHRVKVGGKKIQQAAEKIEAKPLVFEASPCALSGPVFPIKGEPTGFAPGSGDSLGRLGRPGAAPLEMSPREEEKVMGAAPAIVTVFSLEDISPLPGPSSQREELHNSPAQLPPEGASQAPSSQPEELSASNTPTIPEPLYQELIEVHMFQTTGSEDWKVTLYCGSKDPEWDLKPRIPDCLVNPQETPGSPRGVWGLDGSFLPLTRKAVELGDMVERISGCPLRMRDWEHLVREMSRPESCRLTLDKLLLVAYAATRNASLVDGPWCGYTGRLLRWEGMRPNDVGTPEPRTLSPLLVVPELLDSNFGEQHRVQLAMNDTYRSVESHDYADKLAPEVFPFLHFASVSPKALLSPRNAGKLLDGWFALYRLLVLPPKLAKKDEKDQTFVPETVRRLVRGTVADISMPAEIVPVAQVSELLEEALFPIRQGGYHETGHWLSILFSVKRHGVEAFDLRTRADLVELMLTIYCHAPNHWTELDQRFGAAFMQRLCPLSNWAQLRAVAHERVRALLLDHWEMPYSALRPTTFIG